MSKILLTGGTGLVGQSLLKTFSKEHEVHVLSRRKGSGFITWDPSSGLVDAAALENTDIVIHLAGANLADRRWSASYKKQIRDSRINTTRFLVDHLRRLKNKPKLFISASAIGFYGAATMKETKNESSSRGPGFLAELCDAWEEESKALVSLGIRVVHLRFGVILSPQSGALAKMLPIFNLGLGGKLGDGQQPFCWISINEIPRIIDFIIKEDSLFGPINVVSPQTVTNNEFTQILCKVLKRPVFLPVPALAIRILMGEMGDELLLKGTHVFPNVLVKHGYSFQYPELSAALTDLLSSK